MAKTFTYTFSDPANSDLTITTGDTPQDVPTDDGGTYQGFAITGISGTFNGSAVTGLVGSSGAYQQDANGEFQDNAIFVNATQGDFGTSSNGIDEGGLAFSEANGTTYNLYFDQGALAYDVHTGSQATSVAIPATLASTNYATEVVCFAAGTRIRVARGDVAVENLVVGDIVVTSGGADRPVRWLGHRAIDCRNHPRPLEVQPVRVAAHAFGPNRPAHDLMVSPGHSLCVDVLGEVLIPAMALINGTTVVQEDVDRVVYWHVELDEHDVLFAENMPAESYLEMGNRGFFAENAVVDLDATPDTPARTHADFCRPFHPDGAVVEVVRKQLDARARQLGWRLEMPELGDVHLLVDGVRVDPRVRDLALCFTVPAGARHVLLVSGTARPCEVGDSSDTRRLGLAVARFVVNDGFSAPLVIEHDDERLRMGFHAAETSWRWTAGCALLPADLWAGVGDAFFLRAELLFRPLPRWTAPQEIQAQVEETSPVLTFVS